MKAGRTFLEALLLKNKLVHKCLTAAIIAFFALFVFGCFM